MRFLKAVFGLAFAASAMAQNAVTLDRLKQFVTSSVQQHMADRDVAAQLHKMQLSNQIDDRTIEDLQALGAGPKTVAALTEMQAASVNRPKATPPAAKPQYVPPPPPSPGEQNRILTDATEYAENYTSRMPDYICMQVTRRSEDARGTGDFRPVDTIAEKLTFFEKQENYAVISMDGKLVTGKTHEQLGGTTSSGEFASLMRGIFAAQSDTEFHWTRWATLRGHRMNVFTYRVTQGRSNYRVRAEGAEEIVVGYHGIVFVDNSTSRIMKITLEADDLPSTYPVQAASVALDYDNASIGGTEFLLPLRSEVILKTSRKLVTKNEAEFRMYRKFTAESTIKSFEDPVPDAPKEQPPPIAPKPKP